MGGLCPKEDQTDEAESKQSGNVAPSEAASGNAAESQGASGGSSEQKQPDSDLKDNEVLTRREIRSLSDAEVDRFVNAINKMMESNEGPGSSEYFRLAVNIINNISIYQILIHEP